MVDFWGAMTAPSSLSSLQNRQRHGPPGRLLLQGFRDVSETHGGRTVRLRHQDRLAFVGQSGEMGLEWNRSQQGSADLIGHPIEAAFPADIALGALAVAAGTAPQALVTGFGVWRGEALALVEPIAPAEPFA